MEAIAQYGLPTVAIVTLAGVVVFLYNDRKALQAKYDELQEKRVQEAKETYVKLIEPMNEAVKTSEKSYDLLLTLKRGN